MTVPSEFSLELDGLREQGSAKWMENLQGVLHGLQCIVFHGLPDFVSSPPQEFVDLESGCRIRHDHHSVVLAICTHLRFALTNVR
jgi:hypothetical protein